jgi:hypothetical protein
LHLLEAAERAIQKIVKLKRGTVETYVKKSSSPSLMIPSVGGLVEVFTLPHVFRTIPMRNATESDGVRANLCGVRVSPRGLAGANLAGTPM